MLPVSSSESDGLLLDRIHLLCCFHLLKHRVHRRACGLVIRSQHSISREHTDIARRYAERRQHDCPRTGGSRGSD